jgi:hypothetical protein
MQALNRMLFLSVIGCACVFGMSQLHAENIQANVFKQQIQSNYTKLKKQKTELYDAVMRSDEDWKIIQKACAYSNTLKQLKQMSLKYQQLDAAKTELVFVSEMDRNFDQSFEMYGTSYQRSCTVV